MNIRLSTLFWMFVIMAAALGLYSVKYKVQNVRQRVAEATTQLKEEREALRVIEAEWVYLNRGSRLEKLAARHLKLAPVQSSQMAQIANIPYIETNQQLATRKDSNAMDGVTPASMQSVTPAPGKIGHGR